MLKSTQRQQKFIYTHVSTENLSKTKSPLDMLEGESYEKHPK